PMAGLRFTALQSRPIEFLDLTSLTPDEFQQLVSPFEAAFHARMATWRMDGKPRTARRFTVYKNCPHSIELCGGGHPRSAKAARGEDLQIEHPICGGHAPTFHFHPTLARVPSPTLIRDQVVQVRQPCEKRLLAATGVVKLFHGEQLALKGVVSLIQQGARHGHLWVGEHRIPTRLLVLKPASHALAIGRPRGGGEAVHKLAEPLPQGKHPQTLALARPVEQGVELRAQRLAHWGRDGHEFLRELEERVAQAGAHTDARKERPQTLDRAVKAIGEGPFNAVRRLLLE